MNGRSSTANETPEGSGRRVGRHRRSGPARRAGARFDVVPRHERRASRRTDAVRTLGGGLALVALAVLTGLPHGASASTVDTVPAAVATTDVIDTPDVPTTGTPTPAGPGDAASGIATDAPSGNSTDAPVEIPTDAPSAIPTDAPSAVATESPDEASGPTTTTTTTTSTTATAPAAVPAAAATPTAGRAEKKVCEKFGSTPVAGGRYEVQNSLWGASTPQCIVASDGPSAGPSGASAAFRVEAKHRNDSGPASYPSVVFGCNYGNCTKGTPFPRPIADLGDLRSSWSVKTPSSGDYAVAYDIWLDPTPRKTGRPTGLEIMVWLKHTDRVQPIGKKVGTATLGGVGYDVWQGKADLPTISYVRQQQTDAVKDLSVTEIVADAKQRGQAKEGWYLTSVQAGFEPWIGGDGLETTAFSVTRNGQ